MHEYTFYVGSTYAHDAWQDTIEAFYLDVKRTIGVWAGRTEHTAVYYIECTDDQHALRIATAAAAVSRNRQVLVTRPIATQDTHGTFTALDSRHAVRYVTGLTEGDRTLYSRDTSEGYAYRRAGLHSATHAAWLVNAYGDVTGIDD